MKCFWLIKMLFIIVLFKALFGKQGYKIRTFKLFCSDFNETNLVRLERCELIAKRGYLGLANIVIHYKGVRDLQMTVKFFYRGTSGKYQPFVVDFTIDLCDLARYSSANQIVLRAIKVFEDFDSNLMKGCPLVGPLNISNYDYDKESEKFYPPVIAGLCFS